LVLHSRQKDFLLDGFAGLAGRNAGVLAPINLNPVLEKSQFLDLYLCSKRIDN
jgi:hypothetical protein